MPTARQLPAPAARAGTTAPTDAAPQPADKAASELMFAEEIDRLTGLPALPRFPWVTWRSQALEEAARRRAAVDPAPSLGTHVATSA